MFLAVPHARPQGPQQLHFTQPTTLKNTMPDPSSVAGPSTPKSKKKNNKKRAAESGASASKRDRKAPRIDDDDAEVSKESSVDPMAALDAALEKAPTADGEVEEATDAHIPGAAPVRADEYELEAEREVEASKGLGGDAVEEGKMKLVHQVRHQVSSCSTTLGMGRIYTELTLALGRCSPQLSLHPHRAAQAQRPSREGIQVRARPFPARLDLMY